MDEIVTDVNVETNDVNDSEHTTLPASIEELQALLDKQKEDLQKDFDTKLDKEVKDAVKFAKMSKEQKEEAMAEKRRADLDKRELELTQKQLELDTIDLLNRYKMPLSFKEYVMEGDSSVTEGRIQNLQKLWNEELNRELDKRLAKEPPKAGTSVNTGGPSDFISIIKNNRIR